MKQALAQIDAALAAARELDSGRDERPSPAEVTTICISAIERLTPPGSSYRRLADQATKARYSDYGIAKQIAGVLSGLRQDFTAGYLQSLQEESHAEVFADLLEDAEKMLRDGYIPAAAVIAGGALETHLRILAEKSDISASRGGKPKKASTLNDDLAKGGAYTKTEQKQVTAWQGLRNDSAHGGEPPSREQAALMIQGIRDFIGRHPA